MKKNSLKKRILTKAESVCCGHDSLMDMLNTTSSALGVIDKHGKIVFFNAAMEQLLGYKSSEITTLKDGMALSFPDKVQRKKAMALWVGDARRRKPPEREFVISRTDGSEKWCRFRVKRMKNGCVVLSALDVSDLKSAARRLRKIQFAVEHSADAVFLISDDAHFIYVNDKACKSLGYTRKKLLTMTVHDIDPLFTAKVWPKHWRDIRKRGFFTIESMHKRKNGTTFPVEISLNYLNFEGQELNYAFARDISDRKQSDRALLESESSFTDLANVAYEAIVIHHHGKLIKANTRFYEMFGYDRPEFYDSDLLSMIVPQGEVRSIRRYVKAKCGRLHESVGRRKDGSEFPIEVRTGGMEYEGRKVDVFTVLDITDRKHAENALRDSESRFRSIVESSPMGMHMYRLDDENRLIFIGANPAADRILGIDHNTLLDLPIEQAFPSLVGTDIVSRYRNIAITGKRWSTEQLVYKDDKIEGVFEVHAFRTAPRMMVARFFDITKRTEAAAELRRLAAAVDSAAESIVITDVRGNVIYVNPWFEKMTGFSRGEVIGKNTRIFSSGKHDRNFYADIWSTILSGKTWHGHFINKKKDGTLFEEDAVISPVIGAKGDVVNFVAVKRDVTQEMLLERQILQSQKMAAIGQLAHRVAHNFTNMLVIILGNAQLAKATIPANSDTVKYLDEVVEAANRVSTLTAELLAFAHPADVKLRVMQMRKALIGIGDILKETIPSVQVNIDISEARQMVNIDPVQMEQALLHLAINADEAMGEKGGSLSIKAGASDLSAEFAMITVTDSGVGMTEEMKQHAFEPFSTTKNSQRNQGLGLATTNRIITQHGGLITVDSVVGQGSTFKIYLPLAVVGTKK